MTLRLASANSRSVPEPGPVSGIIQIDAGAERWADDFGLRHFQLFDLEQQAVDLFVVGQIVVAIGHAPCAVGAQNPKVLAAFDVNGGDIVDLKIREDEFADFCFTNIPCFRVAFEEGETGAADDTKRQERRGQIVCDSYQRLSMAARRRVLTTARHMPDSATTTGIAPMFRTLVWNSKFLVSFFRLLTTLLSSLSTAARAA